MNASAVALDPKHWRYMTPAFAWLSVVTAVGVPVPARYAKSALQVNW